MEERILIGLFLCSAGPNEILEKLKPEWNEKAYLPLQQKLLITNPPAGRAGYSLLITKTFPWKEELSNEIDHEKLCESFFVQPDLFLRIRPGHEKEVKAKLGKSGINFKEIEPNCLSLSNASKVEDALELDKEVVVQDYGSQQIGEYFKLPIADCQLPISAWDCCAASGGKSIMLYDIDPSIELTVSDIRESILTNLKKRFFKAGITNYKNFIADLTTSDFIHPTSDFEIILCDAPCTGSGTWSRTPEQLYYFDEKRIGEYASLQKKIVSNIIPHLQSGGYLFYITCSVFKKENEEVIEFARKEFNLELIEMKSLKGYDKKADTMFVALLQKL